MFVYLLPSCFLHRSFFQLEVTAADMHVFSYCKTQSSGRLDQSILRWLCLARSPITSILVPHPTVHKTAAACAGSHSYQGRLVRKCWRICENRGLEARWHINLSQGDRVCQTIPGPHLPADLFAHLVDDFRPSWEIPQHWCCDLDVQPPFFPHKKGLVKWGLDCASIASVAVHTLVAGLFFCPELDMSNQSGGWKGWCESLNQPEACRITIVFSYLSHIV